MYQCQKCDYVFPSIEELDNHYYTVHPQELENVAFQQENYQDSQPNSYPVYQQNPYQATQQTFDFSCYRCNKYFYDFESLNHHAETEHKIVVMPNVTQEQDGIPNVIVENQIVMPQEMQNALQNVIHKPNVIQKQNVMPSVIKKKPKVIQKKQIVMPNVIQKQNVTQKHIVLPNAVQKQNFMPRAIPNQKFPLPPKRDMSPMVKIQAFKNQPQNIGIGMKYCF